MSSGGWQGPERGGGVSVKAISTTLRNVPVVLFILSIHRAVMKPGVSRSAPAGIALGVGGGLDGVLAPGKGGENARHMWQQKSSGRDFRNLCFPIPASSSGFSHGAAVPGSVKVHRVLLWAGLWLHSDVLGFPGLKRRFGSGREWTRRLRVKDCGSSLNEQLSIPTGLLLVLQSKRTHPNPSQLL